MKRELQIMLMTLFLFTSQYQALAQSDSIQDNSYYFDDGGLSEMKNLVKINVLSIVLGDLPVYYERILGKYLSIEVGAGILLPYYLPEIPELTSYDLGINNPDFGFSIWIHPKYYIQHKAPELSYLGIQLRRRNYNQDNQTIVYTDLTFNFGRQLFLGKRFVFDYNFGVGSKFKTQKSLNINNERVGVALPVGIKIGIML